MTFHEYQIESRKTATYPVVGHGYVYPALELCGEAGEVAEKIKKLLRDKSGQWDHEASAMLENELGDVLWPLAQLCTEFNISMESVAQRNLDKLRDRQARGVISGSGDTR